MWEKKEEEEAQAMDHGESDQEESVRQQLSSYRNCLVHHLHHHQKVYYILCMNLLNLPHDFCLARIISNKPHVAFINMTMFENLYHVNHEFTNE